MTNGTTTGAGTSASNTTSRGVATSVYIANDPNEVTSAEAWLGRKLDAIQVHGGVANWSDWQSSLDWVAGRLSGVSADKMWSVGLIPWGANLADAGHGDYNDKYLALAKQFVTNSAGDSQIYIRLGWEMNTDGWNPWSAAGKEADYVKAYQQFVDTFRSVSDKFVFEWCPNWSTGVNPETLYPGDKYVDVVGMDFYYNSQWSSANAAQAWDYFVKAPYGLQWQQDFATAHGKPTAASEWGVNADKPAFVQLAAKWFDDHHMLYQNYWNSDAAFQGELSNGQYPAAGAAFKAAFGSDPYVGAVVIDRGHATVTAGGAAVSATPSGARATFTQDFKDLSLWNGKTGVWETSYYWQGTPNGSSLAGEKEWYIDARYAPTADVKPWTVANGVLSLTAQATDPSIAAQTADHPFTSGQLNTSHSFAQTYGYFEIRAQLPANAGSWPAFWLVNADGSNDYELDILEAVGSSVDAPVATLHNNVTGTITTGTLSVPGASTGFHTYGVDWQPDYITWYYDNVAVMQVKTPAGMNKDMFLILNLAVGGGMAGDADPATFGTAAFDIDYVHVYTSRPVSGSVGSATAANSAAKAGDSANQLDLTKLVTPTEVKYGTDGNDTLIGSAAVNQLYGGAGDDRIYGGDGNDSWLAGDDGNDFISGGNGNDAIGGGNGDDVLDGDAGDDQIYGGAGNDVITGGTGNDFLVGDTGVDRFVFAPGSGRDYIADFGLGGERDAIDLSAYFAAGLTPTVTDVDGSAQIRFSTGETIVIAKVSSNQLLAVANGYVFAPGTVWGTTGADVMTGGAGDTIFVVDNAGDIVKEAVGGGNDTVRSKIDYTLGAGQEIETLQAYDPNATTPLSLTGNEFNNTVIGNAGNNSLYGGRGEDTLIGGAGDDAYLVDSAGDKVIEAVGGGNDTVTSTVSYTLGAGQEIEALRLASTTGTQALNLTGNEFANTLMGNAGNNILDGGAGADVLIGGLGNDTYVVDDAGDVVREAVGGGNDTVRSKIDYTLAWGQEIETLKAYDLLATTPLSLTGNEFNNTIIGNAGNNILYGGKGEDALIGGAGDDAYLVDSAGDTVTEAVGGGYDTVTSTINYTLGARQEIEALRLATTTGSQNLNLTGNEFANMLTGNAGNNVLDGGAGADVLIGGLGNDTYVVDDAGDVVREAVGGGNDTVRSKIDYTLGAGQEIETLQAYDPNATTPLSLTGNEFNNTVIGNAGNNTLYGGKGEDMLIGGAGNDAYLVDSAGDKVIEAVGGGYDTVTSTISYTLGAGQEIEALRLASTTGTQALNLTGNEFANTLMGNAGKNILDGGAGADVLNGGAGDDVLIGGKGGDTLTGGDGNDIFRFLAGDFGSAAGGWDTITDFGQGDKIDFAGAASMNTAGARFNFIGNAAFSGHAGEINTVKSGGFTTIAIDFDGDKVADVMVKLTGQYALTRNDFVL